MAETISSSRELPIGSMSHQAPGWWGVWCLIATEGALFAYLLFSYFYLEAQAQTAWIPELPPLHIALPNTVILVASSFVLYWGEKGIEKGSNGRLVLGLIVTLVMGIVFVGLQGVEWHSKKFGPSDSAYASSYFTTTGFHMMHVVVGLIVLAVLLVWALLGKFSAERHAAISIGALYWHFVDVVWLAVFTTYYLLPYVH